MSLFPATIPVALEVATGTTTDRLGVSTPTYTTQTGLWAYWIVSTPTELDPTVGAYTEKAELGVPADFPAVAADDLVAVDGRVWAVDGPPADYSHNPFADQWAAVAGELPGKVIRLRRTVNYEGGS